MDNLKIFICTHKKFIFPRDKVFIPLLCGADFNDDIGEWKDNKGDNISSKNRNYSELTGLYWIWKNINFEYVGLCHYRRYFSFNKNYRNTKIINYNSKEIIKTLEEYDIVLPQKFLTEGVSVEEQYKLRHIEKDWEELKKIIKELYPEYYDIAIKIFNEKELYPYNMFIAKKNIINKYCEWLFSILFELEKRIEISTDFYQARVFGFISERLMNVYITKNNLKVKEIKTIFFDENGGNIKSKIYKFKRSINKRMKKLKEIFHV